MCIPKGNQEESPFEGAEALRRLQGGCPQVSCEICAGGQRSHATAPPLSLRGEHIAHVLFWTPEVSGSLTLNQSSALKGPPIVAQGKRVSAPSWVDVTTEVPLFPAPRGGEE